MDQMKAFRRCLAKFATGVTVVTCADESGRPYGITANSFSSVSLEPPLILWNVAKVSNSLKAFLDAKHFAINILTNEQQHLSAHFAKSDHTLFDSVETIRSPENIPLIPGTLACFICKTYRIHDCGDHYIVIGEVVRFESREADPLLFYNGKYAALNS
ncbi:MAG: flavin reductase family protein [Woeseiaceae bacterium]|nr:flavin reductase family protein [Woeseiaceae bacterium]